jgi:hypothetical protein
LAPVTAGRAAIDSAQLASIERAAAEFMVAWRDRIPAVSCALNGIHIG